MKETYIFNITKANGELEQRGISALTIESANKRINIKANRENFTYAFNCIALATV